MKWLRRILIALLGLVVAVGIFGVFLVRRSFPQTSGEIAVAGLDNDVTVTRDIDGVAHIFAKSAKDMFMAQGYVVAQDRFWQMDVWRHIGAGRLSEMFGEGTVETDMFLRALGFVDQAEQEFNDLGPFARDVLEWYADGVNAYLADHHGAGISLEYAVLGIQNSAYSVEPWTPINTMTWAKLMSWDLSGNMQDEIARAVLSATIPIDRVEQLYPDFPAGHPVVVPDDLLASTGRSESGIPAGAVSALRSAGEAASRVWALTGGGFEGIGSNNWVLGGSRTETGMPILANDPHLAPQIPSIWYEIGLHCTTPGPGCVQDRAGFTFPGTPGIVIGHNEHIAWGVTTEAVDTQDLFVEKINPADPNQYQVDGQWLDMEVSSETIAVAGGEDVTYEVKSTRHGPIISDLYLDPGQLDGAKLELPNPYSVSLSWETLHPSTLVEAIVSMNEATDYQQFREAASLWDIAAQNIVYADIEGNIAYQSTGRIPVRSGWDGRWPVPGWDPKFEWSGSVPFDEMPAALNPQRGYLESANQPVTPPGLGPFEGLDGDMGYRAARIDQMINDRAKHSVSSAQAMQMDSYDAGAAQLIPYLAPLTPTILDSGFDAVEAASLVDLMVAWGSGDRPYQATGDSLGAAVYQAFWRQVLSLTFDDELPEDYRPSGGDRWVAVVGSLLEVPGDPWWDDRSTEVEETRDDILVEAVIAANQELKDLLGTNRDRWTWGRLHTAEFENQTLGKSGIGAIESLFNRTAPPRVGGGPSLVNATGWDATLGFAVDWVPSMRMVVDLSDLARSTSIHTTGQSGHAFNRHYDDMIERWVDGLSHPMRWTPEQIALDAVTTLTLVAGS